MEFNSSENLPPALLLLQSGSLKMLSELHNELDKTQVVKATYLTPSGVQRALKCQAFCHVLLDGKIFWSVETSFTRWRVLMQLCLKKLKISPVSVLLCDRYNQ